MRPARQWGGLSRALQAYEEPGADLAAGAAGMAGGTRWRAGRGRRAEACGGGRVHGRGYWRSRQRAGPGTARRAGPGGRARVGCGTGASGGLPPWAAAVQDISPGPEFTRSPGRRYAGGETVAPEDWKNAGPVVGCDLPCGGARHDLGGVPPGAAGLPFQRHRSGPLKILSLPTPELRAATVTPFRPKSARRALRL